MYVNLHEVSNTQRKSREHQGAYLTYSTALAAKFGQEETVRPSRCLFKDSSAFPYYQQLKAKLLSP